MHILKRHKIIWILLLGSFFSLIFAHGKLYSCQKSYAKDSISCHLKEQYGCDFQILHFYRSTNLLRPSHDRFVAKCRAEEIDFDVWMYPLGEITDSYGVQRMYNRIVESIHSCAAKEHIANHVGKITWRLENLYHSDSDYTQFYEVDPTLPLSSINRLEFIQLKEISSVEQGLAISKQLLISLYQEVGISLDFVEIYFNLEQSICSLITSTQKIETATISDIHCFSPRSSLS